MRCQAYRKDGKRCNSEASDGILCDAHMIMQDMSNFPTFNDWNLNTNLNLGWNFNMDMSLNANSLYSDGLYSDGLYANDNFNAFGLWNSLRDWTFPVIDYIPIPMFGGSKTKKRLRGDFHEASNDSRFRDLADFCQLNLQHLITKYPNKMVFGILDVSDGFATPKVVHLKGYEGQGRLDNQDVRILKKHADIAVAFLSSPACKSNGVPSVNGYCPPNGQIIAAAHNRSLDAGRPILFVLMDKKGCWVFSPTGFALTEEAGSHPMIKDAGIVKVANTLAASLVSGKVDAKKYLQDCHQAFGRYCKIGLYPFFTAAPTKGFNVSKVYRDISPDAAVQWNFTSDVA